MPRVIEPIPPELAAAAAAACADPCVLCVYAGALEGQEPVIVAVSERFHPTAPLPLQVHWHCIYSRNDRRLALPLPFSADGVPENAGSVDPLADESGPEDTGSVVPLADEGRGIGVTTMDAMAILDTEAVEAVLRQCSNLQSSHLGHNENGLVLWVGVIAKGYIPYQEAPLPRQITVTMPGSDGSTHDIPLRVKVYTMYVLEDD